MSVNVIKALELLLVFGGLLAFCVWQLRDLKKEERKHNSPKAEDAEEGEGSQPR